MHQTLLRRLLPAATALVCMGAASAQTTTPDKLPIPAQELRTFATAYSVLRESSADPINAQKLFAAITRAMAVENDPEGGAYYTEEELAALKKSTPADVGGVGLQITQKKETGDLVLTPLAGGPAQAAGLRQGDRLISIDGQSVFNTRFNTLVDKLRGPIGSTVVFEVARKGEPLREITVQRRYLEPETTTVTRLGADIALLKLPSLNVGLLEDATAKLHSAWRTRPFTAIVLDLRGNTGGLLDVSFGIAAMFLPPDTLLATTTARVPAASQEYRATQRTYAPAASRDPLRDAPPELKTLPMAVLVDAGTASGAEIIAAALQDHGRATLVGQKTFGRGTIQTLTPIPGGGAIKYTSAYWLTPSGARIHKVGVTPQVEVSDAQKALDAAVARLKQSSH